MERIVSPQNSRIKELAALKKKERRRETGLFLLEGEKLIFEAVKSGIIIEQVFFDGERKALREPVFALGQRGIPLVEGNERVIKGLCETVTPQGIVAVCRQKPEGTAPLKGRALVLDRVRDPGNLGTLLRTAEATGMDTVLCADCAELWNPKVIRSAMGSLFRMDVRCFETIEAAVSALKEVGFRLYGAALKPDSKQLGEIVFTPPCAVMIGNEAEGIAPGTLEMLDETLYIPMQGEVESLNAAAAGAMILWEMRKG